MTVGKRGVPFPSVTTTSGDDSPADASPLQGRSLLVTGGAGSAGQAIVARALKDGARRIVIYSRDEAKQAAMLAAFNDDRLRFVIGDVRDRDRLTWAMRACDDVIHAAALKRVEVCDLHPREARQTNIEGTGNVIDAAIHWGVRRCLFLSTDKAAAANTAYGASKAMAEFEWLGANAMGAATHTRFACTRYGNVLNSRGSVVPTWRTQASNNGTITMTDPEATRFWMSLDQAVDLVVHALGAMRGGEIFVPVMRSSTVGDLADAVAPKTTWRTVGLRPSEKLHETLVTEEESRRAHACGDVVVIEPEGRSWGDVAPLRAPRVPAGYTMRSDTAERYSVDELREIAA